jgi:hypothetical protein
MSSFFRAHDTKDDEIVRILWEESGNDTIESDKPKREM